MENKLGLEENFYQLSEDKKLKLIKKLIEKYHYNDFEISIMFNHSQESIIEYFKELDYKVCSRKQNCKNPDGPLLSRNEFYKSKNSKDYLTPQCKKCIKFKDDQKNLSETELIFQKQFNNLETEIEKENFILFLYKVKLYKLRKITRLTNYNSGQLAEIFKKHNIKVCSNIKCKNPNGRIQSRENFTFNKREFDELHDKCNSCIKFRNMKKFLNEKEFNYQKEFKQIQDDEKQKQYLKEIYIKEKYSIKHLKLVFDLDFDQCIRILKELDIKICSNIYCVSPAGRIQSRNNFYKNQKHIDNLDNQCIDCMKSYNKSKASYEGFYDKLIPIEEVKRDTNNTNLIQVKCTNCNNWFNPSVEQIQRRIQAIEGRTNSLGAENRFYCSDKCKQSCSIYNKQIYREGENQNLSREVQPELRKLVLERDNYTCIKCGNTANLHCHHIEGIQWEPLESADMDMCITVCEDCHKEIHSIPGCTYQEMQCN